MSYYIHTDSVTDFYCPSCDTFKDYCDKVGLPVNNNFVDVSLLLNQFTATDDYKAYLSQQYPQYTSNSNNFFIGCTKDACKIPGYGYATLPFSINNNQNITIMLPGTTPSLNTNKRTIIWEHKWGFGDTFTLTRTNTNLKIVRDSSNKTVVDLSPGNFRDGVIPLHIVGIIVGGGGGGAVGNSGDRGGGGGGTACGIIDLGKHSKITLTFGEERAGLPSTSVNGPTHGGATSITDGNTTIMKAGGGYDGRSGAGFPGSPYTNTDCLNIYKITNEEKTTAKLLEYGVSGGFGNNYSGGNSRVVNDLQYGLITCNIENYSDFHLPEEVPSWGPFTDDSYGGGWTPFAEGGKPGSSANIMGKDPGGGGFGSNYVGHTEAGMGGLGAIYLYY